MGRYWVEVAMMINRYRRQSVGEAKSQHRGVSWHKAIGKWQAHIRVDGKQHVGDFAEEVETAAAYSEAAEKRPVPEQSSQHRGVSRHKARGKWTARIGVDGKKQHLGSFDVEAEAAAAYSEAAVAKARTRTRAKGQPLPARGN